MFESKENINLLGALIANINNILLTILFLARINKYPRAEYWFGIIFMLSIIPLMFMFINAIGDSSRNFLYFVQLILIIGFIVLEFFLDYLLKIDFRQNRTFVIIYLTVFYASFGGMIGIASHAGRQWTLITVITFVLMTTFSLLMHFKTNT
jgi:hypothetical protein